MLAVETWEVHRLVPYDKNVKKHDPAQVKALAKAIKETGWDQPIVIDVNGVIIKGHGRRLAALDLGLKEVPVIVRRDLTPEQVRAARLTDNRVAVGDIDTALLREELSDFNESMLSMLGTIFTDKELDFTLADLGTMNTDVFVPDVNEAVLEQEEEARQKADQTAQRKVPLGKAFGVTAISGSNEIVVTRFMAAIEAKTGKQGEEALLAHMKEVCGEE